jgi:hypothetical protein
VKLRRMTGWAIRLTADDALRAHGTSSPPAGKGMPFAVQSADSAVLEAQDLVRPVVFAREYTIRERDGTRLSLSGLGALDFGAWTAARLRRARRLAAVVCTIGSSLEERCRELMASDPVVAVTLDALGSAALEGLAGQASELLCEESRARGLEGVVNCHPGANGWPTEVAQPLVFSLLDLDPASQHDVRLLPSMVMRPLKSLTYLLGLTREPMAEEDSCGTCAASRMCRYRSTHGSECT